MHRAYLFALCLLPSAAGFPADAPLNLKDPTQPPVSREAPERAGTAPHEPVVSAIFVSPTRSVAVFNDQPVRAGDHVGGYRIEEVSPQGVRYVADGHTKFAPLTASR